MKLSPVSVTLLVTAATVILTLGAVPVLRGTLFYPSMTVLTSQDLRLEFSSYGVTDSQKCKANIDSQAAALLQNCPACRITEKLCVTAPAAAFFKPLSEEPLEAPSTRHADGVILYLSTLPGFALAVCRESEKLTAQAEAGKRLRCYPAAAPRPRGDQR